MSMAPKEQGSPYVSLVQVLSRGKDNTRITHRPMELLESEATLKVLLTEVIQYWLSNWKTVKSSFLKEEEEEEEEEVEEDEDEEGVRRSRRRMGEGKGKEEEGKGKEDDQQKKEKRAKKRKTSPPDTENQPPRKKKRNETNPIKIAADGFLKPGGVAIMI